MYVLCIMERDRCYTCIIMCPRHTLTIRFSPDFTRLFWTALVGYSGSCSLHISQQLYALRIWKPIRIGHTTRTNCH